jgi:hypothetical protein
MSTGARIERLPLDGRDGSSQHQRSQPHGRAVLPLIVIGAVALMLVLGAGWLTGVFGEAIWWLTNTTPPTLALSDPTEVVRGQATIAA